MKHLTRAGFIVSMLYTLACLVGTAQAQENRAPGAQAIITKARVEVPEGAIYGPVYVTIAGRESKIADRAMEAWVIRGGRQAVYSGADGAGGFEDEGQSLHLYDARTGKTKKIMSEYVAVNTVTEVTTSRGKTALLVDLVDGGLGGHYLAVVNPERGEVFFRKWAKLLSRRGDRIVIGHYREDDWEKFQANENARVRPYKTERQNLNIVLQGRVIHNKRDRP